MKIVRVKSFLQQNGSGFKKDSMCIEVAAKDHIFVDNKKRGRPRERNYFIKVGT